MNRQDHWDNIYRTRPVTSVSWFCEHDEASWDWIEAWSLRPTDPVMDVGGGASTFVDDLLCRGFSDITILDVSEASVAAAQRRLGEKSATVKWVVGDVLDVALPERRYRLWRDRAVFHFLTEKSDRIAYVNQLRRSLAADGEVLLATFAADGPEQCSNLPVVRYDEEGLQAELGRDFALVESKRVIHETPAHKRQAFLYCHGRWAARRGTAVS